VYIYVPSPKKLQGQLIALIHVKLGQIRHMNQCNELHLQGENADFWPLEQKQYGQFAVSWQSC